jgi:hypothetical protein
VTVTKNRGQDDWRSQAGDQTYLQT